MPHASLPHDHGHDLEVKMEHFPPVEDFQALSEMFRQLSDGTRLRLFWILCHCRECVTNLAAMMGMSSPALSHHLRQLKAAGLITSHREGKEVYYEAVDSPASQLLHDAMEHLMQITCPWQEQDSR